MIEQKYMLHPIEIITIMRDYQVEEYQVFSKMINNAWYHFKIIDYVLYISTDQKTWQPTPNVL
jgi:hypothetical protein